MQENQFWMTPWVAVCLASFFLGILLFFRHIFKGLSWAKEKTFRTKVKAEKWGIFFRWKHTIDTMIVVSIERYFASFLIAFGIWGLYAKLELRLTSIIEDGVFLLTFVVVLIFLYELFCIILIIIRDAGPLNLDGFIGEYVEIVEDSTPGGIARGVIQTKYGPLMIFVRDILYTPLKKGEKWTALCEDLSSKVFMLVLIEPDRNFFDKNNPTHVRDIQCKYAYVPYL